MKLQAKFGEQEMKIQAKFGVQQMKVSPSFGNVTIIGYGGDAFDEGYRQGYNDGCIDTDENIEILLKTI